ncbi:hypothetical protein BD410DRAFT_2373 [Rickenella mellea]|uniref:Uncharacterized protein n=1 Tax=Rickenella mellea TaxID=50990 RepID=A0A4R5XFH4_9AGAM|nr:hypothetical protein BD410DRAFT_2373 [Rickenella mellea]
MVLVMARQRQHSGRYTPWIVMLANSTNSIGPLQAKNGISLVLEWNDEDMLIRHVILHPRLQCNLTHCIADILEKRPHGIAFTQLRTASEQRIWCSVAGSLVADHHYAELYRPVSTALALANQIIRKVSPTESIIKNCRGATAASQATIQ